LHELAGIDFEAGRDFEQIMKVEIPTTSLDGAQEGPMDP